MTRTIIPALLAAVMAAPSAGAVHAAVDAPAALFQEAQDTTKEKKGLPLEADRTLRFTATEGTWISLDVSPDGETIVFELLGDLYTLPIEGGRARQLTSGMAFDAEPRFSPDGERIVFTSDRSGGQNLWILSLDLTDTVQVTKGKSWRYQSPEWTPDGKYIVASRAGVRNGRPKLWMFHVDGGKGIQLIDEPENLKTIEPAFGADHRYIWFSQRDGGWDYNAILPQYQIAVYDRETGKRYTRSQRWGSAFRPTLSPDGRWLVYGTRRDDQTGLRIRDLETGEERWLAFQVQHDAQEGRATRGVLPGMSFTPDSRAVIASYDGGIWRIPVDGAAPERIPFTVDVELALGPKLDFDYPVSDSETFTVRQIRDLAPSPDGRRLAFVALDRLYVMELPDGEPEALTDTDASVQGPTWSPDGEWIAFAAWRPEGGHLYRIRPDGDDLERVSEAPALYRNPAWSPDGERIVAIRASADVFRTNASRPWDTGFDAELVWVPADGGDVRTIAPTEGRGVPHFSRDPERIYVYSEDDGLVSMRWDGTDLEEHLKVTGVKPPDAKRPVRAAEIRIAPDGERVLAQVLKDLYVIELPYVGGEAPTVSVANPKNAAVPARKLTTIGGEFPAWGPDGRTVHWALGNAHFTYDLEAAEADTAYAPAEERIRIAARRDLPRGTVLLQGARVVTMGGPDHEEVLERGDVLIRNNRIAAVGPTGTLDVPADAEVIDVSGTTIVPGFVDTHAHIWPAWGVHREQVWEYLANLAYGVTTTRDPQTATTDVLTYADRVRAGDLIGPRIYSTGPGVFWNEQIGSYEEAEDVLRRYSDYYDTKTIKMYVAGNREQRQWIIKAARKLKLMPTTEGSLNFKLNLTQMIDGYPGHEHSFPVYPIFGDVVKLTREAGTTYTPTLLVSYGGPWAENYFYSRENPHDDPKLRRFTPHEELDALTRRRPGWFHDEEHVFEEHARFVKDLIEAGGRAGVGSHGQLQGLGYHWELWAMAAGGLDELDALKAATVYGAQAIGLDGDLGSIAPGMLADLVVLEKNPLDDIRNTNTARYVMKNGRLYDADTLDEVWPRTKPLAPQWWWEEEPEPVTTAARGARQ